MATTSFLEQLNKNKPLWQHGRAAAHINLTLSADWRLGGWRWAGLHLLLGGEFGDDVSVIVALPGLVLWLGVDGLFALSEEVRENGRCYGFGPTA